MKAVILAAGQNDALHWPLLIDKPKSLYSYQGQIQLERVINNLKHIVAEEDIIVVAGYKAQKIRQFIQQKGFKVRIAENQSYTESALFSLKAGLEGIDDDVLLLLADESIALHNLKQVAQEKNALVCLVSDKYPYYCVNLFKISKDNLTYFTDERYLKPDFLKEVQAFLTNDLESKEYDPAHLQGFMPEQLEIKSGIALGLMCLDIIRRIGKLDEVIRIVGKDTPSDLTTVPYDENRDYIDDLDHFRQTDDYQNNRWLRLYFDWQINGLKVLDLLTRIGRRLSLLNRQH